MTIFYLVCCLIWMTIILCNIYFADAKHKIDGKNLVTAIVLGVIPVVNTLSILAMVYFAFKGALSEKK